MRDTMVHRGPGSDGQSSRFFERFSVSRLAVVEMLDCHRAGRADFALSVWTIYNAVAWFDCWVDKAREVRVA